MTFPCFAGVVAGTPGPYDVSIKAPVYYATSKADSLIECKPIARAGHFNGPLPVMMLIHGGAWVGGNNAVDEASSTSGRWCSLWASWGFDTFSVGYRLTREAPWPAQIVDVQAAIRWVRAHTAALHINPGFVVANGDSAGGQLAMIAGYNDRSLPGDLATQDARFDPQPQLVISQFGPWTFGPWRPAGTPSVRAVDHAVQTVLEYTDGRIASSTPKTLFVQGTRDGIVGQCSESQAGYKWLKANGRPASYIAYDGDHEFIHMDYTTWKAVVGAIQVRTIAFAYARAHFTGALPRSEAGPQVVYEDASLPPGC